MRDVSPPNTGRSIEAARVRADFYSKEPSYPPGWFGYLLMGVFAVALPLALWAILAAAGV